MFVEGDMVIKRYEVVKDSFSKDSDDVTAHGQKEERKREGHRRCSSSCHAEAITCQAPQSHVFFLNWKFCGRSLFNQIKRFC